MSDIRILLDEHVWNGLIRIGQEVGVDVLPVQAALPEGTNDADVLAFAAQERRLLFSSNTQDFAPLAAQWFQEAREHWGIVIVPGQTNKGFLSRSLRHMAENYTADFFRNRFLFIQEVAPG
jgi:hypothetical protein